jgi:replicative DNA helicase
MGLPTKPENEADETRMIERQLLGALLRWPSVIPDVFQFLRPNDFQFDNHRIVCNAILDFWYEGKIADAATLADKLFRAGRLEDVGSYRGIAALLELAPTGCNAVHHGKIIRDKSILRQLAMIGAEIMESCRKPTGTADEILEDAEQKIFRLSEMGSANDAVAMAELLPGVLEKLLANRNSLGVPTGYFDLDLLLSGFHAGEMVVIAARPSQGKTSLGVCLALSILKIGVPVFFCSLEQSREEIVHRCVSCFGNVNSHRLHSGRLRNEERDGLPAVVDSLLPLKLFIDDKPCGLLRISATARALRAKHQIGLVMVDYLQLVDAEDRTTNKTGRRNRQEEVASVSRGLKRLAKELRIPVVAMAQLNRDVENRADGRPKLSDLRESGSIEADADVVILMHRLRDQDLTELDVAKNRNGPVGSATLYFRKEFMRFENYAPAL